MPKATLLQSCAADPPSEGNHSLRLCLPRVTLKTGYTASPSPIIPSTLHTEPVPGEIVYPEGVVFSSTLQCCVPSGQVWPLFTGGCRSQLLEMGSRCQAWIKLGPGEPSQPALTSELFAAQSTAKTPGLCASPSPALTESHQVPGEPLVFQAFCHIHGPWVSGTLWAKTRYSICLPCLQIPV